MQFCLEIESLFMPTFSDNQENDQVKKYGAIMEPHNNSC